MVATMSWRRGLFRLWIAVTLAWVVAVAGHAMFAHIGYDHAVAFKLKGPDGSVHEFPVQATPEMIADALSQCYKIDHAFALALATLPPGFTIADPPPSSGAHRMAVDAGVESIKVTPARSKPVPDGDYVLIALAPPVAVSIIAWAGLWIGDGFRPKP
jgi:hypothetical protein